RDLLRLPEIRPPVRPPRCPPAPGAAASAFPQRCALRTRPAAPPAQPLPEPDLSLGRKATIGPLLQPTVPRQTVQRRGGVGEVPAGWYPSAHREKQKSFGQSGGYFQIGRLAGPRSGVLLRGCNRGLR